MTVETHAYLDMAATEDRHWWFVARRQILFHLIAQLALPPAARILEIGAGSGGNLAMLRAFGEVDAIEGDATARNLAQRRCIAHVYEGWLPDRLPERLACYDLICLFDVLEHIADDVASLVALRHLLKPGGRILVTVPAYKWLWSRHDVLLHHHRRYRRIDLVKLAAKSGFTCARLSYFNMFLLPLVATARFIDQWHSGSTTTGVAIPAAPINDLLHRIFASERFLLRRVDFPTGTSLYAELVL